MSTTIKNLQMLSRDYNWSLNEHQNVLETSHKILYLPLHGWEGDVHGHTVPEDFLLRRIDPKRVKVCLGFLDFCDPEVRKIYTDLGWQLTCAGARDSLIVNSPAGGRKNFLYQLTEIFDDADFIVANEFTTGLFYAAARGKSIGILPTTNRHEVTYSSWESIENFHHTLNLQKEIFPWLWGEIVLPERIMSDMATALGVESFRQADFFHKQVEKIEFRGYGKNQAR